MKSSKKNLPLVYLLFSSMLLISCAEQLSVSPEIDISPRSVNTHNFKASEGYPGNSDVFYEDGKTIVRPKQKMNVKEFMNSYPYELHLDSTFKSDFPVLTKTSPNSPKELPPCNYKIWTYHSMGRYAPYPGKLLVAMLTMGTISNRIAVSVGMRDNYGFSQAFVNQWDYPDYINIGGWNPSQIILQLSNNHGDSNSSISLINLLKNSVAGFLIDEPFDDTSRMCVMFTDYVLADNQVSYVCRMANLANPKPLFVSSWISGGAFMPCNLSPFYGDFFGYYNSVINSTNNTYIMCDKYDQHTILGLDPELSVKERWDFFKNKWTSRNPGASMRLDYQDPNNSLNTFLPPTTYPKWGDLFPKAKSLGLNLIYLYAEYQLLSFGALNRFCSTAFYNYYLRGFAQTITVIERCDLPNCVGCDNIDINNIDYPWYIGGNNLS
jgi:hypothetical protein